MRTLPFDCHRCAPEMPDENCRKCLRWASLPGQTYGERTPTVHGRENSSSEDCTYIPAKESRHEA